MRLRLTASLIPVLGIMLTVHAHGQEASSGGVFAEGGHSTDQPIEIESDELEVKQEQQVAIFIGNVDAVQGDLRLRSDRLEVHYVVEEEEPSAAANEEGDQQSESIRSLRADGNVRIDSPQESAKGEWADYDVSKRILTLHDNVLLTKGRNVLCGNMLNMDLNTGRSLLKGNCTNSASNKKGRVQGVFFPSKSKN